jgi:hypothetical protein
MREHRTERLRNGGFRDYGLDGLAKTRSGSYIGIQAKAYGPRSTITAECLGTFQLATAFIRDTIVTAPDRVVAEIRGRAHACCRP